jgi:hypothetical protein
MSRKRQAEGGKIAGGDTLTRLGGREDRGEREKNKGGRKE